MSVEVELKNQIIEKIHSADDKLLRMIKALVESYQEEDDFELNEAQKAELERRLEKHEKGEMEFSSWEDVKGRLFKQYGV